eukprot:s2187_g6.t3
MTGEHSHARVLLTAMPNTRGTSPTVLATNRGSEHNLKRNLMLPAAMTRAADPAVRRRLRQKSMAPAGYRRPSFSLKERHSSYVVVKSALSAAELSALDRVLRRKRPKAAKMKNEGAGESDDERKARYDDRDSNISWLKPQKECPLMYQKLKDLVRDVANKEWPLFQVDGAGEPICTYEDAQYTVYRESQHFQAWHQDAFEKGNDPEDARQITVVLMLSDSSNYTGGSFQAKVPNAAKRKVTQCIAMDAGDALIFPAKRLMHRVTVVKSGVRKTLVMWAWDKQSSRYHTALNLRSRVFGNNLTDFLEENRTDYAPAPHPRHYQFMATSTRYGTNPHTACGLDSAALVEPTTLQWPLRRPCKTDVAGAIGSWTARMAEEDAPPAWDADHVAKGDLSGSCLEDSRFGHLRRKASEEGLKSYCSVELKMDTGQAVQARTS